MLSTPLKEAYDSLLQCHMLCFLLVPHSNPAQPSVVAPAIHVWGGTALSY